MDAVACGEQSAAIDLDFEIYRDAVNAFVLLAFAGGEDGNRIADGDGLKMTQ